MNRASNTQLILIEGLPGSGKSSLGQSIATLLQQHRLPATCISELDTNHPVTGKPLRQSASRPDFADRCIESWTNFATNQNSESITVLEGCFFQNTVRFLIEHEHPDSHLQRYFNSSEAVLAELAPLHIYLSHPNKRDYLRTHLARRKGRETVARIARYTESTPWAVRRSFEGTDALLALYSAYGARCDQLIAGSVYPTLFLDPIQHSQPAVLQRAKRWLLEAEPID